MMGTLFEANQIEELLLPYLGRFFEAPSGMYEKLAQYLELLVKWNARTNLTAVREPEQIVRRHFGESLFAGQLVGECETVLDFGSGAGFPGLPIQLLRPELRVTLAESQNKKATFLREVIRRLGLKAEVWAERVEAMPAGRRFDVVTMRAVDDMDTALDAAAERAELRIMVLSTQRPGLKVPNGFEIESVVAMAASESRQVLTLKRR